MECFVCFDAYKDPRILGCGHSFCWDCVKELVRTSNLVCPICRLLIDVGDRLNAKKNYQLSKMAETLSSNKT